MSNHKELGAKEMFKQSLVYLFNSYREQGLSVKEAQIKVIEHIEASVKEYEGTLFQFQTWIFSNPAKLIDEVIQDIDALPVTQLSKQSLKRKLHHIKTIVGGS